MIITILLTLINYFYPILPTPLPNNTLRGILSIYIPIIKEGEILNQNIKNIKNIILGQNISNILESYILKNNIFIILLLLLILY